MKSDKWEQLAQSALSEANETTRIPLPLYLKAIAYFLWAILEEIREIRVK